MAFSTRIKEARINAGMNQDQLAMELRIAKSTLSGYESGKREPTVATVAKMLDILNINADFLYQDEANDIKTDITLEDNEMIKKYHDLDHHGKEMVEYILEKETNRIKNYGKLDENNIVQIPKRLISYYFKNASAGAGQLLIDNLPEQKLEIPDKPAYKCVSYAIGVNGSSMEPAFHDGDILLVEATREIEIGSIGIFQIDGECYVKKLGRNELISLNKDYDNIPLDGTATTLGKVIDKL